MAKPTPRLVLKLRRAGIVYPVRTIVEADRAGIPLSLACALLEQESGGGKNIFGHDPTIFVGGYDRQNGQQHTEVTKAAYLEYKRQRGETRMQGVGPCQLTWWATQDRADSLGGCWRPAINMRVGFAQLADNLKAKGRHAGIAAYNGTGAAAEIYARLVEAKAERWHQILTGT